jgi:hypothetical protein
VHTSCQNPPPPIHGNYKYCSGVSGPRQQQDASSSSMRGELLRTSGGSDCDPNSIDNSVEPKRCCKGRRTQVTPISTVVETAAGRPVGPPPPLTGSLLAPMPPHEAHHDVLHSIKNKNRAGTRVPSPYFRRRWAFTASPVLPVRRSTRHGGGWAHLLYVFRMRWIRRYRIP